MDRLFILSTISLVTILAIHIFPSYEQVQDKTIAGIIVPKTVSTQSQYCLNGHCGTASISILPKDYIKSTEKYPVLLVSLSQTCDILNKNNMTGCPSVKDLMVYDTSNQMISGKFGNHGEIYTRSPPQMKNNWLAYSYSKNIILCVECYFDVTATSKSKEIIIQPNTFSYVNKTESEGSNIWYNFDNRYMQGCDVATIANIPGLLNDTINFMLHDCQASYTIFHGTSNHTRILKPFTFDNPYSTLHHDAYLKAIFHGHTYDIGNKTSGGRGPSDCIKHQCGFIDQYKKAGY